MANQETRNLTKIVGGLGVVLDRKNSGYGLIGASAGCINSVSLQAFDLDKLIQKQKNRPTSGVADFGDTRDRGSHCTVVVIIEGIWGTSSGTSVPVASPCRNFSEKVSPEGGNWCLQCSLGTDQRSLLYRRVS